MIENDIKINVERDLNEIEAKQFKFVTSSLTSPTPCSIIKIWTLGLPLLAVSFHPTVEAVIGNEYVDDITQIFLWKNI